LTEHPFSAVPLSRVIGPRKRPVLAAPPQVQSIAEATGSCRSYVGDVGSEKSGR